MSIRFISEEPRLAKILEHIDLNLLPRDIRVWAITWIKDVGKAVRSREMIAGYLASSIHYAILLTAISLLEKGGINLPIVRKIVLRR